MKIASYWQQEYGIWSQEKFKYIEKIKKPIKEKELEIKFSDFEPGVRQISIIGGPIKTKTYLLKHLIRNPSGRLIISLGVINRFPRVWVEWEILSEIIKQDQEK